AAVQADALTSKQLRGRHLFKKNTFTVSTLPRARRNKQCWPEAYQLPAESVHLERKSVTLNYIVRITIATIWIMKLNIASMRYISIYSLTKRKKSCCHLRKITICFHVIRVIQ